MKKYAALILIFAMIFLLFSCAIGELVEVQYDAEPVRVDHVEDFYGVWRGRYLSRNGVTASYENLLERGLKAEHPEMPEDEIAARIADSMVYLVIEEGRVYSYTNKSETVELEGVFFEEGRLTTHGDEEGRVYIEKLSDGNVRVVNRSTITVFEKEQEDEFLFRGKIRWGMSPDEVAALEGEGDAGQLSADCRSLSYTGISVSKYTGDLLFAFEKDCLVLCSYMLENTDPGMFGYLREALGNVYGEEAEVSPAELYEIINKMRPGEVNREGYEEMPLCKWITSGETAVMLADDTRTVYILYVSPDFLNEQEAESEGINTTGL